MGFRVLLVAVTGKEPAAVHQEYGVVPTGRFQEVPEAPVTGATLPGGAYLLYVQDQIVPEDAVLARLSRNASLLALYANETMMHSLAASWVDGAARWWVCHDAQQGADHHLETSGPLPGQFGPIRDRLAAEQAACGDADYFFDIPVELFAALGGLRYDADIEGAGPEPWEILARRTEEHRGSMFRWPWNKLKRNG